MAQGTRAELWMVASAIIPGPGLVDVILTKEQAAEMERKGFRVARIPVEPEKPRPNPPTPF